MDTIGKRIKYLRDMKKLTQQELACNTQISRGNLSNYEQDKFKPASDSVVSLALFFNISTDWLLTGEKQSRCFEGCNRKKEDFLFLKTFDEEEQNDILKYVDYLAWRRERDNTNEEKPYKS